MHFIRVFLGPLSFLLPFDRVREMGTLLAFYHPCPAHTFHVILVPKKQLDSLVTLGPADTPFLIDLFSSVQSLVAENHLEEGGYRLIVNGGKFQDFPRLHFHLISGVARHN